MTAKFALAPFAIAALTTLTACGDTAEDAVDTAATETVADVVETLPNGMTVEALIKARQEGFKGLGKAFKTISDQLRSGDPDMGVIQTAAASVPEVTSGIETWFPAGTGPESGVKTEALAAIWEKPEDFAAKVADFKAASAALVVASQTGDAAAITAAFRTTGGTCKGCHDNYRLDD